MASSVPVAVPAFITLIEAALPPDAQVVLGSVFPVFNAPQSVIIESVRFTQDAYAEMGPNYKHEEHYNLECCLYNTGGLFADQPDILALMIATYALYSDISVAVATNPTLGISQSSIGFRLGWPRQLDYTPDFDINGRCFGKLEFEVECQARVLSLS